MQHGNQVRKNQADPIPTFRAAGKALLRGAEINRTTRTAFIVQFVLACLICGFVWAKEGQNIFQLIADPWVIAVVYLGTATVVFGQAFLLKGPTKYSLIRLGRDAAISIGALTSLVSIYLLMDAIADWRLAPRYMGHAYGGILHGIFLSEILLAPFETQTEANSRSRLLRRLAAGFSVFVSFAVFIILFSSLDIEDWGKGKDESGNFASMFGDLNMPATAGEIFTDTASSSMVVISSDFQFEIGSTLYDSMNTPIVLTSSIPMRSSNNFYFGKLLYGEKTLVGDFVYPGRRPMQNMITEISIERTGCLGSCPVDKLTIFRSGATAYEGRQYTKVIGRRHGKISRRVFSRLELLLFKQRFFELEKNYARDITDQSSVIISVVIDGKKKIVRNYADSGPVKLWWIEKALEGAAKEIRWVGSVPER